MSSATESFGERLRRLREAKGVSQRSLAGPGVSGAYISRLEDDARLPSVRVIRLLAEKLGVSPDYLERGTPSVTVEGQLEVHRDYDNNYEHIIVPGASGRIDDFDTFSLEDLADQLGLVPEHVGHDARYGQVRVTVEFVDGKLREPEAKAAKARA